MINIRKINKNEILPFTNSDPVQAFAFEVKDQHTELDDVKLCFLIEDQDTSTPIGFYGLSYGYDYGHDWFNASFTIDQLHIADKNSKFDWFDALYVHLTEQVTEALTNVKNRITDQQVLTINAVVPESPKLESLLFLVVNKVFSVLTIL